jgi:hypothetical protein
MKEIAPLCVRAYPFAKASSAKIKENEECPLFWLPDYQLGNEVLDIPPPLL